MSKDSLQIIGNLENPIQIILQMMSSKGLFSQQDIKEIQHGFIEALIKMNESIFDEEIRIALSKLTSLHFLRNHQVYLQPSFLIKEQAPYEDTHDHENSLFNHKAKDKLLPKQQDNCSLKSKQITPQQMACNQYIDQRPSITRQAHAKLFSFLNKSMERLKIKSMIIQVCSKNKAWSLGSGAIYFLRRLITIRTFFPSLFPSIVNQVKIIIREFMRKKTIIQHQIYAKQLLAPRYLNCLKEYSEKDDILEAAKCIYCAQTNKSIRQRINRLPHYQMIINVKASAWKRQVYSRQERISEMELSIKSQQQNLEKIKKISKEWKKTNIQQKIFKKTGLHWNPIRSPVYFELQIQPANHVQFDQLIDPQLHQTTFD